MAERGRKLELRLNALAEKAAASLQRAGLPADGKKTTSDDACDQGTH